MSKAVAKKVPTPKPIPIEIACSLCGEDWNLHPEDATALDCIEILKAKKAKHDCCHHVHWTYTYPWYNTTTWYDTNTTWYGTNPPVQVTPTAPVWYSPNIAGTSKAVISNNTYDEATSKSIAALVSSITA